MLSPPINRYYCIVVLDIKDNILLMVEVLVIEEANQSFIGVLGVLHDQHD